MGLKRVGMSRLLRIEGTAVLTEHRPRWARRWLPVVLVPLLCTPTTAVAGSLAVASGAAATGNYGLQVTLGPTCTQADVVIPDGTFQGDSTIACNSLTANDVDIIAPGATFRAGQAIVLGNGFSVPSGVDFEADIDPFADQDFAYVRHDTPVAETTYTALFDLRLDSLTLAGGAELDQLNGYSADGTLQFRAVLRRNTVLMENRLALFAREDVGTMVEHGVDFLLPAGFHSIQVSWSADGASGEFLASIDGAALSGIMGLNNGAGRIDYVKWGAVDGTISTTTGSTDQDNFWSSR